MKSLAWFVCRKWAVDLAAVILLTVVVGVTGLFAADRINPAALTMTVSAHLENLSSLTSINLLDAKRTESYLCLCYQFSGITEEVSPVQSKIATHHIAAAEGAHLSVNQAALIHFL